MSTKQFMRKILFCKGDPVSLKLQKLYQSLSKIKANIRFWGNKKTYGEFNPDKVFYVIRVTPPGSGFFANFHLVKTHIAMAMNRGMIPIVDMENYDTYYTATEPINGTNNAWEYFFEQPSQVTLDEVYKSKNVVLAFGEFPGHLYDHARIDYLNGDEGYYEFAKLIKSYMKLNSPTLEYVEKVWSKVKRTDGDILAVMSRGSDYRNLKPSGHCIQPEPDVLLKETKRMMRKYKIRYCFLKTEERFVYEMFEKALGDRLIPAEDAFYFDNLGTNEIIIDHKIEGKNAKYQSTLEYLGKVWICSKCDYLITGINSGSIVAIELNGGQYKGKSIIDLGRYP